LKNPTATFTRLLLLLRYTELSR